MTNKEAIELLLKSQIFLARHCGKTDMYNAVECAIKALESNEEVNEFACPYCGDVTYTATDYVPRFCQECGRDMGFREEEE